MRLCIILSSHLSPPSKIQIFFSADFSQTFSNYVPLISDTQCHTSYCVLPLCRRPSIIPLITFFLYVGDPVSYLLLRSSFMSETQYHTSYYVLPLCRRPSIIPSYIPSIIPLQHYSFVTKVNSLSYNVSSQK